MQMTVQSDVLLAALQRVGPSVATSKRNTMPILEHVVIEAKAGTITVAATNQDQGSHSILGGTIDEYGATLVPYKPFISYLKLVPKGVDIHIEREWRHETLALAFGESTATLCCLHAADYVNIPGVFDPAPYEKARDDENAILAEEAGREAAREQARKQAEHDRIAALPDWFVYRWSILYQDSQEMIFDTLTSAVCQWKADHAGDCRELNGEARHGHSITDKFGEVVVRNDDEMHQLYRQLCAPDRYVLRYSRMYVEDTVTLDTLEAAVDRWHDYSEREFAHGIQITSEKTGEVLVRDWREMNAVYSSFHPELATEPALATGGMVADTTYRIGDAHNGPPPGTPCEPAGWAVAEENAIADVIGDIPVDFAPSMRVEVPLQQQEQMQHDSLAEKVERVRAAVVAVAPPKQAPRVTKLRFGYKPQTIERFFARAIRAGTTVKVASVIKHEGNLTEYTPIAVAEHSYIVQQGHVQMPLHKTEVKYLEAVC